MKLGIIARCDRSGLGVQSLEHVRHLNPDKVLAVKIGAYEQFPEWYPEAVVVQDTPSVEVIKEFLAGLDICLTFETAYNRNLYGIAKSMGVKTICQCNYEWLEYSEGLPDLYQCVSTWNYFRIEGNKILLPCPVSRDAIKFRLRRKADTFLHIAGHKDTAYGRNGTEELLRAIPLVKADVKFIIYSQSNFNIPVDSRIDYRQGDFGDYSSLYDEGDVLIYPRRYGGQSLQLNEALSSGMPVLMTGCKPQNEFLPVEWLIEPLESKKIRIKQPFDMYVCSPEAVAGKIDYFAGTYIEEESRKADSIANLISWETLLKEYEKMFKCL